MKARERKIALWVLGILILYTIVGFLILPPIIRAVAVKDLSEDLNRKVSIQRVKVNPFVPSLTIRGLLVMDKDGKPLLSWDEVYVNLEISSVFRKAWTFREISVTGPYARAQMNKNYTYNFSDIVAKSSTAGTNASAKKPSKPLFVRVKRLEVNDARLRLADYTVREPFKRTIGPVYLMVSNFCTVPDSEGSGTLFGHTDAGTYFSWRGNFCPSPLRSAGNVAIFHVIMNSFKPLYQDIMSFDIRSGQSGFCANYRFEWSPSRHVAVVTNAAFGMDNFRLGQAGQTNDIIDLRQYTETGVSGDLSAHRGEIGLIKFSEAIVNLERGTNKALNLIQLGKPKVSKPTAPGGILVFLNAITNAVASLVNTTNKWTGFIHEVDFTNSGAHLLDLAYARPATLDLNRINVRVKNISNIPNTNITAGVSMDWNKSGTIDVGVTARISPPTVDVHLALDKLDLGTLAPYGESQFNLHIPSADFGMNGDVHLYTPSHKLPQVRFRGDTWVDHFHAVDGMGDDLLKWDEIRISGINAKLNPPAASIREISVNDVFAHAVVETNGTINLVASTHPPGTNAAPQTKPAAVAKTSSTPSTNAIPPVSIATIAITNTQIAFSDRSLTPNVNMVIQKAGGTIKGISSTELQHGDVDLHALIDGVGPAYITGRVNPFAGSLTNQVNIFMTNMDLLPTSPYSGKFAGYSIARGALSVDLQYTIVGRKLQSKNVIILDKFTFGEKVDSPSATKLPVKLAIAILKDRNGQIVLNVPIQGSLDDPKFRIGKVVERAVVNILTKVATSPFSLIGAAFGGGGAALSYQDFAPGSTDLSDTAKKKLDVLVKALYDRPGLQLQISGSVDPANDRQALQQIAFDKELRTSKWQSLRKSQRQAIPPDAVVVTPKERSRLVTKLYDEALDRGTLSPAIIAANTNLEAIASQIKAPETTTVKQAQYLTRSTGPAPAVPPTASPQPKVRQPTDPREALLEAIIPISETDLKTLAQNRAKAVRDYLINNGHVDASRLLSAPGGTLRQDGSKVYLDLE